MPPTAALHRADRGESRTCEFPGAGPLSSRPCRGSRPGPRPWRAGCRTPPAGRRPGRNDQEPGASPSRARRPAGCFVRRRGGSGAPGWGRRPFGLPTGARQPHSRSASPTGRPCAVSPPRSAIAAGSGSVRPIMSWVMYSPSIETTWRRIPVLSDTYTRSSSETRTPCTRSKCSGFERSSTSPSAGSVGGSPNAPHIRRNSPVSASNTITRRFPYSSTTKGSLVVGYTYASAARFTFSVSVLPPLRFARPICMTNSPSEVDFRSWSSPWPLPAIQTKRL